MPRKLTREESRERNHERLVDATIRLVNRIGVGALTTREIANLADLSQVEETVIRRRFNWKQEEEHALTLEEVGQIIGVTKERVRQIQNKALMKIRSVMEEGVLRTRTVPQREAAD